MIEIPGSVTVVGAKGEVPFLDILRERRMLVGYFHMWHDGQPAERQCMPRARWRTCMHAT